jgi:hypothetical protein
VPLRTLRAHDLLVLGTSNDLLFVASWCPTNEDLHSYLRGCTGRSVLGRTRGHCGPAQQPGPPSAHGIARSNRPCARCEPRGGWDDWDRFFKPPGSCRSARY